MFSGLKRLIMDHLIAGTLKGAADGKYGSSLKTVYWWVEANAIPISIILGAADQALKYACSHGLAQTCAVDTGLAGPTVAGILALLGITVGAHAAPAPAKPAA